MAVTSEKIFDGDVTKMDWRVLGMLAIAIVCMVVAIVFSLKLIIRQMDAGTRITGTLSPDQRASDAISLIAGIPALAILAMSSVIFLELAPVWKLLEVLVLAGNFMKIPNLLLGACGGPVRLQLYMRQPSNTEEVAIYAQAPCCCWKKCFPPKVPQPKDVPFLKYLIYQYCLVQPVLALIELFVAMETSLGGHFQSVINLKARGFTIPKTISQLTCISACHGLAMLVDSVNPNNKGSTVLMAKSAYCQSYIMCLNLIPNLLSGLIVSHWGSHKTGNGVVLNQWEISALAESVCICIGTLIVTMKAYKAFPIDPYTYPELFQESGDFTESMLQLKETKFCPFCGGTAFNTEPGQQEEMTLRCQYCNSGGLPVEMMTR